MNFHVGVCICMNTEREARDGLELIFGVNNNVANIREVGAGEDKFLQTALIVVGLGKTLSIRTGKTGAARIRVSARGGLFDASVFIIRVVIGPVRKPLESVVGITVTTAVFVRSATFITSLEVARATCCVVLRLGHQRALLLLLERLEGLNSKFSGFTTTIDAIKDAAGVVFNLATNLFDDIRWFRSFFQGTFMDSSITSVVIGEVVARFKGEEGVGFVTDAPVVGTVVKFLVVVSDDDVAIDVHPVIALVVVGTSQKTSDILDVRVVVRHTNVNGETSWDFTNMVTDGIGTNINLDINSSGDEEEIDIISVHGGDDTMVTRALCEQSRHTVHVEVHGKISKHVRVRCGLFCDCQLDGHILLDRNSCIPSKSGVASQFILPETGTSFEVVGIAL